MQLSYPFKLAIIREEKVPVDHRTPLSPEQCSELLKKYKSTIEIWVQPSSIRCFPDAAYQKAGATLREDLSQADLLIGVKEVPIQSLVPNKHYLFFSHTHKLQPYNQKLIKVILDKGIMLTDYECLTYPNGTRLLGFGRFAGIVGAYNGLRGWGLKQDNFELKPAYTCEDMQELFVELKKASLKNCRIALTGKGRVAKGAREILEFLKLPEVSPEEFVKNDEIKSCFTNLDVQHYNVHKEGKLFDMEHFFKHGEEYRSSFKPYIAHTDLFITGHFWDNKAPSFFKLNDIERPDFRIQLVADISCDITEPVPTTLRASSIEQPFYDVSRVSMDEQDAFSSSENITVMAVDNLPCELPKDASEDFGSHLMEKVLPLIIEKSDPENIIYRATIAKGGKLNGPYLYMKEFAGA